jgi:hypothetical protein
MRSQKLDFSNVAHPGNGGFADILHPQIYRLSYLSTSLLPSFEQGGDRAIQELQTAALARNQKRGVTGLLAFNDWRFAGVLEGSKTDVFEIFRSIQKDRRHADIVVVEEVGLSQRGFAGWAMAFVGDPGPPRLISADLQLKDIIWRESWTATTVVEMLKYFLLYDPPKC